MSLPPRERGLKFVVRCIHLCYLLVAPSAGAWIEIFMTFELYQNKCVAPSAGAWIEIAHSLLFLLFIIVAPSAGAWIEIINLLHYI